MKVSATFSQKKHVILPWFYQQCLVESTKKWIIVMKYEGECIKNMEWVESYENFIQQKTAALTFLLPTIFFWIDKIMNDSDEVWRWLHEKYGMSRIIQNVHSIKNSYSYLAITDNVRLNRKIVMKYEGESTKKMECIESYRNNLQ